DTLRLWQSRLAPDLRRVTTISETSQALGQPPLFGLERRQIERGGVRNERNCRFAEILDASTYVGVRAPGEVARTRAANTPDEGAILGVDLLHALVGLDSLRPADTAPRVLGNDDAAATGGDDAAPAESSGATADQ